MDSFLDTFVGDIPKPASQFNPDIPQEGIDLPQYNAVRVEQLINDPAIVTLTCNDADTSQSVTTTEDMIATQAIIQSLGIPSGTTVNRQYTIYIDEKEFRTARIAAATNTESFNAMETIPLPNWYLPAGTIITITFTSPQANASEDVYLSIIGHKKK